MNVFLGFRIRADIDARSRVIPNCFLGWRLLLSFPVNGTPPGLADFTAASRSLL